MKYLIVFLVFAMGAITIGEKLNCIECKAKGEDCTGESVECENEGDFCITAKEYDILNGNSIVSVSKGCTNISGLCDNPMIITSIDALLHLINKCCFEDDCNSDNIKMPEVNTKRNGFTCPGCLVIGSDKCNTKPKKFPCIDNQEECLEYIGGATRTGQNELQYYVSGCITNRGCEYGLPYLVGSIVSNSSSFKCSPALKRYKGYY
uniref:Sodefrin-like factor D n=1 Tax=Boana cinerascens TaxID=2364978 RepID=A0A513ZV66_9NEOB|nr:sodefrin precursor-like factor D [Boana cinerascens]